MSKDARRLWLMVRVSPDERAQIRALAKVHRRNVSEFVRWACFNVSTENQARLRLLNRVSPEEYPLEESKT